MKLAMPSINKKNLFVYTQLSSRIGDRKIYGWKPKTSRNKEALQAIILIGAPSTGHVYFIDPKDPESQRIYVICYRTLQDSAIDLNGLNRKAAPHGIGYAVYAP